MGLDVMGLDVYLFGPDETVPCTCDECGHKHNRFIRESYFSANITHNLAWMAREAGLYAAVWRPGESGYKKARDIIQPLRDGIARLLIDPDLFKRFDHENGGTSYIGFISWLERYLAACEEHPDADIEVSR
jgi:hypothetical protein